MPASVWIRCLQLLPYMEEREVECVVNDSRARADIVVFVRSQDEQAQALARRLKRKGTRILFDLCVNYFDETGLFPGGYGTTSQRVAECLRMTELADVIICGSRFIQQRASAFHPHAVYLPESVDRRHFRFRKAVSDFDRPALRAVWCGQPSKAGELGDLYSHLAARSIPLTVISERRPELPGPFTYLRWSYRTFPRSILGGEVCVAPRRTDNPYDLGHSHFKIGVLMSQGVPALAAPVPSYQEVIGRTGGGQACGSPAEWEAALDRVLEDRELLRTWSEAAWRGMAAYSSDLIADQYVDLFFRVHQELAFLQETL